MQPISLTILPTVLAFLTAANAYGATFYSDSGCSLEFGTVDFPGTEVGAATGQLLVVYGDTSCNGAEAVIGPDANIEFNAGTCYNGNPGLVAYPQDCS